VLLKGYRSFGGIIFGIAHTSIACTVIISVFSRDGVCGYGFVQKLKAHML